MYLDRLVTFMLYLNGPEAGGNTVFSQAGISVKPVLGSALYWFNQGAQNNFDSRTRHSGKYIGSHALFLDDLSKLFYFSLSCIVWK